MGDVGGMADLYRLIEGRGAAEAKAARLHDALADLLNALDWRHESGDSEPYFQARHAAAMLLDEIVPGAEPPLQGDVQQRRGDALASVYGSSACEDGTEAPGTPNVEAGTCRYCPLPVALIDGKWWHDLHAGVPIPDGEPHAPWPVEVDDDCRCEPSE